MIRADQQLHDCLRMAEKMARNYAMSAGRYFWQYEEDFVQEARIVTLLAWETFDPLRGTRFSTWCTQPIRWRLERVRRLFERDGRAHCSLDTLLLTDVRLVDVLPAAADVEEEVVPRVAAERVRRWLGQLSPHRQAVIRSLYFEERTAISLAAERGVRPQAVHHVRKGALSQLRRLMEAE